MVTSLEHVLPHVLVMFAPFAVAPLVNRRPIATARDYVGLNTGVMLLRRTADGTAARVLSLTWNASRFRNTVWEQSAMRSVLGASKGLRDEVTILDNVVLYIARHFTLRKIKKNCTLRWAAPLFHPAGCFLFKGNRQRHLECMQTLREHLAMANMRRACTRLDESLLLPRPMFKADAHIPRAHGQADSSARSTRLFAANDAVEAAKWTDAVEDRWRP